MKRGKIDCYVCNLEPGDEVCLADIKELSDSIQSADSYYMKIGREETGEYYITDPEKSVKTNIKYCPLCGRKLRSEIASDYDVLISISNTDPMFNTDNTSFSFSDYGSSAFDVAEKISKDLGINKGGE